MFRTPESDSVSLVPQTVASHVMKYRGGAKVVESDRLAIEEPLEIAVSNGEEVLPLGVAFRTPGEDEALVLGMLIHEGIISDVSQVVSIKITQETDATIPACRAKVQLAGNVNLDTKRSERVFPISSACGACGKTALDSLRIRRDSPFLESTGLSIGEKELMGLPGKLEPLQAAFKRTGGLHAAAAFDSNASLIKVSEDIGRHNAMDKLVGSLAREKGMNWEGHGVLFSGRVGYDLMQKAISVGCPFVACIGAPSSFAVELANLFKVTLVGFLRDSRFNVYSAPQRIQFLDNE